MAQAYAPNLNVACPTDDTLFRNFSAADTTLNPLEQEYVKSRTEKTVDTWKTWIHGPEVNYDMSLFNDQFPTVAISLSGGSLRGALWGSGVINAFDARNETAQKLGTGGLFNVAQYLAALSGGSWAAISSSFDDGSSTLPEIVSRWLLELDLIQPGNSEADNAQFFERAVRGLEAKILTGIQGSAADIWANMLSPRFLPGTNEANFFDNSSHGAGILFSDLTSQDQYKTFSIPFPIIVACSRTGNESSVSTADIVYEMTTLEFGSYDPGLNAMVNMKYAGTTLNEGKPLSSSSCVTAFDQAGFNIATSSDVFDQTNSDLQEVLEVIQTIASEIPEATVIQAVWPNAFKGINPGTFPDSNSSVLRLDDGSENGEDVPVEQLTVKPRNVDVIVIADATGDTTDGQQLNFPNGTSLLLAQSRLQGRLAANHQPLPPMPSDFASTGVNLHTGFFGCDPEQNPPEFPLVIYVPNQPPCTGEDPVTNAPSTQSSYSQLHQQLFLDQAFLGATCGFVDNATGVDPNFPVCLKCAALDRARLFADPVIPRSSECQSCFDKYCFNPDNPPSNKNFPGRKFLFVDPDSKESFAHKHAVLISVLSAVIGALLILSFCFCICCLRRRNRRSRCC